jgi:uncharacterized membrane protein
MNDDTSTSKERLKFIDMARSIAIILMLQGHFITLTFAEYKPMIADLRAFGTSGSIFFDWWVKIRGFTAPLFFTITGTVFVYLLTKSRPENDRKPFFYNHRVKRGFWRSLTVIFWGYCIQINLKYYHFYLSGHLNNQFYTFHILQSIGLGISVLLLVYGIYSWIGKGPLYIYYFIGGVILFTCYPFIHSLGDTDYFPQHAPRLFQNMIHGPKSEFPIVPWTGFVLFGGMFGAMLNKFHAHTQKKIFPFFTVLFGILLLFFGRSFAAGIDHTFSYFHIDNPYLFQKNAWLYDRLAEVVLLLGLLMILEKHIRFKAKLFLKMGQNTLPIYILHVIILYGAISGYSLKTLFKASFNPIQSIFGAVLFVLLFALFTKYIENITETLRTGKVKIHKKFGSIGKLFIKR